METGEECEDRKEEIKTAEGRPLCGQECAAGNMPTKRGVGCVKTPGRTGAEEGQKFRGKEDAPSGKGERESKGLNGIGATVRQDLGGQLLQMRVVPKVRGPPAFQGPGVLEREANNPLSRVALSFEGCAVGFASKFCLTEKSLYRGV